MYGAQIHEGMINQDIKESKAYKTYLDFATGKATPKKARKSKKVTSPSKKLDTPGVSVSKKKALTKVDRDKGMDLLSEAALLEAAQLKKTLKKSKLETHNLHNDDEEEEEYVRTPDNYEFTDTEEEYEELYKDVNVRLRDIEHGKERKEDVEKTDAGHDAGTQETTYEQVKDDEHVILTTVHDIQTTEVLLQSSSISSKFATQFLNLYNPSPADTEINSMMNIDARHKEPSTQTPPLLTIPVMVIPETLSMAASTIPLPILPFTPMLQTSTPTPAPTIETTTTLIPKLPDCSSLFRFDQSMLNLAQDLQILLRRLSESTYEAITSLTEFELKKILLDKMQKSKSYRAAQEHRDLYDALVKSYKLDKDLFESYGKAYSLKRDQSKSSSSKGTKSQPKSSGKSVQADESMFKTTDIEMPHNQGSDLGNTDDQPNIEAASTHGWFKKSKRPSTPNSDWNANKTLDLDLQNCQSRKTSSHFRRADEHSYRLLSISITDRLNWNNPEGQEYPFDLSKPLPLIEDRGRQVVHVNYFINNDIEYLKGKSSSRKYTTSTIKTKAAKYDDIQGIKDMVPSYASNRESKHKVFSTKRIIAVTHTKVMKWYDYGYLEKIVVRREDQKLYKFKEDVLSFLSGSKTFNWESKATRRNSISLGQIHSGLTSPKELHTLHTSILKELSM
nr:hypothetical protein [Tanacetum cinerariifolium]